MSMCNRWPHALACLIGLGWILACSGVHSGSPPADRYGFGHPPTDGEVAAWNIDIAPTGEGLPPGRGTAGEGAPIYAAKCAGCHGQTGIEGPMPRLVGGQGTLASDHPIKTVGSYWPYATTIYDYVRRTMPYSAPQSLTSDETYAVTAWLLFRNGIIAENAVIDARTLPAVQMPNRKGFVADRRPDVH